MRTETAVLVIGGGPAGSMAASLLAREGVDVTVVEKERFPRFHIGESLITSAIPLLDFVGALPKVEEHGFLKKYDGFFRVKRAQDPGHVDFRQRSRYKHSYQVDRAEFDHIMLRHAADCGAHVYEETAATAIGFDDGRPARAELRLPDGSTHTIGFDHLVDASGQSGLMSSRYLKNRRAEEAFANVAVGSYFRGATPYRDKDGVERVGAFFMEALTDGTGWTWAIPLADGRLSVGVVMHREAFLRLREDDSSPEAVFERALACSPDITAMVRDGERVDKVRVWRDYSYFADSYAGPGYRLIGDAAGFIDPLFSTGVHMAFLGALSASATICAEIKGELSADELERFHHRCLSKAYTRLIITVAGFYRQLHDQENIVLPGVTSENFQLAFDLIQPVVSGNVDLNSSEIDRELLDKAMRYTTDIALELHGLPGSDDIVRLEHDAEDRQKRGSNHFAVVDGLRIRMERGSLGVGRSGLTEPAASPA
ncbi:NAD(P)/FAD-dependent oxidoreductase [Actinacidiphila acididurans]|uniref:Tryptophan 7-halogenase n=1 Tax=Actinacidiphila acididurans TaxID=2784346 RepID=A0ABS2U525_9ACTN|nr:NAD(P)/FAD-dependent oxidoreductase [Actinacidiphila acididurans]MBM9510734.1 tryptophan 7-halogenase [Actinacidiphila acididurans]